MRLNLVCYADENMTTSQEVCLQTAMKNGGFDDVFKMCPSCIDADFYNRNKHILEAPCRNNGKGFWLWKPYCIEKAMNRCQDGDILVYSDSGIAFLKSIRYAINCMDQDIFLFGNTHNHAHWCKANVMDKVLPGRDFNTMGEQAQASVIIFKVNAKTRAFVKEWLELCQLPGMIDDSPSDIQNHPEFSEHRHDQAILTCLAIRDGYKLHWWPTQYGHYVRNRYSREDAYPQLLYHHRFRNNEYPDNIPPTEYIKQLING